MATMSQFARRVAPVGTDEIIFPWIDLVATKRTKKLNKLVPAGAPDYQRPPGGVDYSMPGSDTPLARLAAAITAGVTGTPAAGSGSGSSGGGSGSSPTPPVVSPPVGGGSGDGRGGRQNVY